MKKKCEQYVHDITQERVVLIVSGAMSQHIVPRMHNLSQLSACYIFCGNKKYHETWANQYSKVINY